MKSEQTSRPLVRKREGREDRILDAAQQIIAEKGYTAMNLDDLAARAEITKPTLYRYFSSKEDIAVRAVIRLLGEGRQYLESLDPNSPALERIEQSLRWLLRSKHVTRCLNFGAAHAALLPLIKAHPDYRAEFEKVVAVLSEMVEAGKREGTISKRLDTRIAVQTLFSVIRDSEYRDLIDSGQSSPETVIETLAAVLINGLRTGNES
jgi:AcrR family transcriptional regulator